MPDGSTKETTVKPDGTWSVSSDTPIKGGEVVTATQTEPGKGPSPDATATVTAAPLPEESAAPVIMTPKDGDITVTGTGIANATILVTLPDGSTKETTVKPDGTWSVTSDTPLKGGEVVTATQTEPGKGPSPDATATVTAAPLPEESAAPIITTPKDGDTTVTGTGIANSSIVVSLPDGSTKETTVGAGGTWSITTNVPLNAGEVVSAKQIEPGKIQSPNASVIVSAATPLEQSVVPAINTPDDGDTTVSGTGIAGSTIIVKLPDGSTKETTVLSDGTWSVTSNTPLNGGEVVKASQTELGKSPSPDATATVSAAPLPEESTAPVIATPQDGDTTVSGTGIPGATIIVKLPDGSTKETTVNPDGTWSVSSNTPLNGGEVVTATQTELGKGQSPTATATVSAAPQPAESDAPTITTPKDGDTNIEGTGTPGSIINVTLPDGSTKEATVKPDGTWSVTSDTPLNGGEVVTATQTEDGKRPSPDASATVTDAPLPAESNAPTITTPKDGDTTVDGTGTPGSTVIVTLPDGSTKETTVNPDGSWSVPTDTPLNGGEVVTATQTEEGKRPSPEATATVTDAPLPAESEAPTITTPKDGDTKIDGTGTPGSTVIVTLPDGSTKETTVNPDGSWNVPTDTPLNGGEVVSATQTEEGKRPSPEATATVTNKPQAEESKVPNIVTPSAGDTQVDGSGVPGADIKVTLPDGSTKETTVKPDGTWSVTTDTPLEEGDTVKATQTESGKNASPETSTTVTASPQPGQSTAPAINAPKDGDTTIDGTGVPGATVVVTLPDGTTKETTVKPDGTWSVDTDSPLSAGETIKATQTEDGKTPSNPASAVVDHYQADKYDPTVVPEVIGEGEDYDLTDNVSNLGSLPTGTIVEDVTPAGTIDVNKPGKYNGTVKVTYPDGSSELVEVPVTVIADNFTLIIKKFLYDANGNAVQDTQNFKVIVSGPSFPNGTTVSVFTYQDAVLRGLKGGIYSVRLAAGEGSGYTVTVSNPVSLSSINPEDTITIIGRQKLVATNATKPNSGGTSFPRTGENTNDWTIATALLILGISLLVLKKRTAKVDKKN